jgi:hypothetical protein
LDGAAVCVSSVEGAGGIDTDTVDEAESGQRARNRALWCNIPTDARREHLNRVGTGEVANIECPIGGERNVVVLAETRIGSRDGANRSNIA